MVRKCLVPGCLSGSKKSRESHQVHRFPSGLKSLSTRRTWVKLVFGKEEEDSGLAAKINNNGVCSKHFNPEDYVDWKAKTCSAELKLGRLGNGSVPSHDLGSEDTNSNTGDRGVCSRDDFRVNETSVDEVVVNQAPYNYENIQLHLEVKKLRDQLEEKNTKIHSLRDKVRKLEDKLQKSQESAEKVQGILQKLFTENEVRILEGKVNKFVHYNEEEMTKAITLHTVSNRAYEYLRELGYPYPSVSTIHRWLQRVEVFPGKLIKPVLHLIKQQMADALPMDRICAIALDEMKISPTYTYDVHSDAVLGGKDEACTITVRGVLSDWKYIIHYDWQKNPTHEDWITIIKELHSVGFDVRGHVSDMGSKNQRLWKLFEVGKVSNGNIEKTWYSNPVTGKKIWTFPDFPHLLKLLRNHLLDNGIFLPDGGVVDKRLMQRLIEAQKSEFKLTPVLTHRHIHLKGQQRQNVATAFQIFSRKVSCAIGVLLPHAKSAATFIGLVNDFSDLLNSRNASENHNPAKCAFGMKFGEQEALLESAYDAFSSMKIGVRRRKTYAPFQKGLLMLIISLRGIFADLREDLKTKYIMTAKLNQDYLENIFSQIRGIGRMHANPTALEFQYRVKKVICSRALLHPSSSPVAEDGTLSSKCTTLRTLMCQTTEVPDVSTRDAFHSGDVETILDKLTDLEWNTNPQVTNLEDLRYDEKSDEGGKEYVAGFIARKFSEDHPSLSRVGAQEMVSGFWVKILSRFEGGLCEPSTPWMALFRKFEDVFQILFGSGLLGRHFFVEGVVSELYSMLTRNYKEVPSDVIKYYSKLRVLVRVKHLNKAQEDKRFKLQELKRRAREERDSSPDRTDNNSVVAEENSVEFEGSEAYLNESGII